MSTTISPKNILPNASFELPLGQEKHGWVTHNPGQGAPDNWTDFFHALTLPLATMGRMPETSPVIEAVTGAPDGGRVVAMTVAKSGEAHLTSPVVPLRGGQAYTLSAYARSETPSVTLRLDVWARPMDWREDPDARGHRSRSAPNGGAST